MLHIVRAPVGTGKTQRALQTLTEAANASAFPRVWVLMATRRQEDAFRQRLIDYPDGQQTYFNVEFFNFYELYRYLLHVAAVPSRCLTDAAQAAVMRAVIAHEQANLTHFAPIADRAGFARIVGDLIYELKQNRITPQAFQAAARDAKDHDLARIYSAYQNALIAFDLVDREGEGWLALECVQQIHDAPDDQTRRIRKRLKDALPEMLIVDGFDQFNPLQVALLVELTRCTRETWVTLTRVPARENTIGRRFEQAFDALIASARAAGVPVKVETLDHAAQASTPDVQHLIENIFAHDPPRQSLDGALELIEEPDIAGEVAAVLRRVKALLLNGTPPDQIMITLRDWALYQPYFLAYGAEFGVPLALHYGLSLADVPVIKTLLDAVEAARDGFTRRDVLAILKSPYAAFAALDADAIAKLEAASYRGLVVRGRDQWLEAIRFAAKPPLRDEDDDSDSFTPLLTPEEGAALEAALTAFFDALTPPQGKQSLDTYIRWIENLIGVDSQATPDAPPAPVDTNATLNMMAQVRAAQNETVLSRDLQALDALMRALRGMLNTQRLVQQIFRQPREARLMKADDFFVELHRAVESVTLNPRPNRSGQVLVTTAADARGLSHDVVFVLGLAEGLFPAPVPPDPLYLDSERARLTQGGASLRARTERATDDGLFYELICLPRQHLILSRPTAQDGTPWEASHLWRAVEACFALNAGDVRRRRAGQSIAPQEAASLIEFAASVSSAEYTHMQGAAVWLSQNHSAYWSRIQMTSSVERARLSPDADFDGHTGRIRHAPLREQIAAHLNERHRWSATKLKTFAQSPYQFFSRYLLRLEPLREPEEGMDALQRGTLAHGILEAVYRRVKDADLTITPDNLPQALNWLNEISTAHLHNAPHTLGFRASALWTQERETLSRSLEALVTRDFTDNFAGDALGISEARRVWDLEIAFPYGTRLSDSVPLTGRIDRIDRAGDTLIVIDYKTGARKYELSSLRDGMDFQMYLYLRAAEAHAQGSGLTVAGGFFWGIDRCEDKGQFVRGDGEKYLTSDDDRAAEQCIMAYVEAARAGDFFTMARKPEQNACAKYCDFTGLCRLCGLVRRENAR